MWVARCSKTSCYVFAFSKYSTGTLRSRKKPMVISVQQIFQEVREEEADHEKNRLLEQNHLGCF